MHHSAPCSSLHLHLRLPWASTADLRKPKRHARASTALIYTQQRHTLTQEGNGDFSSSIQCPKPGKAAPLCIGSVSHTQGNWALPRLLGEHPQPSSTAPKPNPCGTLQQILGCAKCLKPLVPMVHLTKPKRSGELSCGRAWLPFSLVVQFIASVLPSMHQFLIHIQTQVKVSPVI